VLRPLYLFHLNIVLPGVERFWLQGAQDFAIIGTYSTRFGDASAFARMLGDTSLEAEFRRFFFGCATGVCGSKPLS
jgi:demethylmenaquinone methyltransferase/2-methoxy-6-polyprenyl-1,4-benzoquinol methylase